VATSIAIIFATNDDLALRALDGLTQQQLWQAPTQRNNAMLWIAGHVVQHSCQFGLLRHYPVNQKPAGNASRLEVTE
jgi:hypothetical protein